MVRILKKIAESSWFQNFIILIIIAAGVVVGLETYPSIAKRCGSILHFLNDAILWIFVVEVVIKMGAEGRKPWRYFHDPWNVFDFLIVAACFMPVGTQYVMVLRLARLLRVLKLVRALPKLQILVGALIKSLPSIGYISILLMLLFYLYAVTATFLFSGNDPVHFGSLQMSMLSLFRAVTLEDWTDLMYIQMQGCDKYGYDSIMHMCTAPKAMPVVSSFFFVSFVLVGTMVVLNLFIGVIMTGMDEAKKEANEESARWKRESMPAVEVTGVEDDLLALKAKFEELQEEIYQIHLKAVANGRAPKART